MDDKTFDSARAERAINFIQSLTHTSGRWEGEYFELFPWQYDLVSELFGRINPQTGFRQYRVCYVEIPKKNGKSALAAAIALLLLCADDEFGAEVYSAASDQLQASIVFRVAAQMVRQNNVLSNRLKIVDSQKRIIDYKTNSFYRVLSSEAYSKHGFNISGLVIDELHAINDQEFINVLTKGSGAARTQPITFIITTAGFDRNSSCWTYHKRAIDKLQSKDKNIDPLFLPIVYSVPEEANWEDETEWIKANPSIDYIFDVDDLRNQYQEAKQNVSDENYFRRTRLNQWTEQNTKWMSLDQWDACDEPLDLESLRGRVCYGGLDLASTRDIAAFILVFPPENGEGFTVLPFFFVPQDTIRERSTKDRQPYDQWTRQGFMIATPGNVIDYEFIKAKMKEVKERYDFREVAYDRWGATQISVEMQEDGLTMVPMGQGFASMSSPTKELEKLILKRKIIHGGNPVLRWMFNNISIKTDPAGNIKVDKAKSSEKVDGIIAMIMGLDRAIRNENGLSIYENRGILQVG